MDAIRRILIDNPMEVFRPLAIFAATFAVGSLVRRLVLRALGAWTERTQSRMGRIMEQALGKQEKIAPNAAEKPTQRKPD